MRTLLATLICSFLTFFLQAETLTRSSIYTESDSIQPGGKCTVAIKLEHSAGWHSYYLNSGGIEIPPRIEWKLPEGFTISTIQWPTPEVKLSPLGYSYINKNPFILLADVTAPADLPIGQSVHISAIASWQICSELCKDESATLSTSLISALLATPDSKHSTIFSQARASIPQTSKLSGIAAYQQGEQIHLHIPRENQITAPVEFIPNAAFVKCLKDGGEIHAHPNHWEIRLNRAFEDPLGKAIPSQTELSGILITEDQQSFALPITTISNAPAKAQQTSWGDFLHIIAGMVIGGLILNLMPCVFPVIGLKIMGFVEQAGSSPKKIAFHGILFSFGVFTSFAALSSILFFAKESIGWGFQLQNVWVIFPIIILLFLMALNMYGVFEIGTSATSVGGSLQNKNGYVGSFFSGILATIVATPCSAPFLGTAIGAAIVLPAAQFFTAFASMALGLSLPYLVLSFFPELIKILPRPGAWMESFKQGMSFLLFATTAFLLSIYAGLIENEYLLPTLLGLSLLAFAAWIYGRWFLPYRSAVARRISLCLSIIIASIAIFIAKPPAPQVLTWETWSPARERELIQQQKPVYIDYTAQWCATCLVNKKVAYNKDVTELIKQKNITLLKADKTKPNPEIETALRKLNRTAIPVNVLIAPGKEPYIFKELLQPSELKAAFETLP